MEFCLRCCDFLGDGFLMGFIMSFCVSVDGFLWMLGIFEFEFEFLLLEFDLLELLEFLDLFFMLFSCCMVFLYLVFVVVFDMCDFFGGMMLIWIGFWVGIFELLLVEG